ncbi:MAG: response regulator [Bacillota bacterium]
MIRIVLAEDHGLVREGTRRILAQDRELTVVAEAGTGPEALALIERLQPEVAILDMRMPGLNAVEVTRRALRASPATSVLVLTAYDDDEFVAAALEAGARGYLLKTARASELLEAVHKVHRGEVAVQQSLVGSMARRLTRRAQEEDRERGEQLTPRELEVLQLAALGLRNKEIATRLCVSVRTVEGHFSSILGKLGVPSRTAAVLEAIIRRLVEPVDP